jgi:hypothetical protein
MDVDNLIYALNNDSNETIMTLTTTKIMEMNLNIIKELHLEKSVTIDYMKKLKDYRYIDEINELKHGSFIKWIPITDPNYLPLNQCGIISAINITDNGVFIVCKNFMHRHYTFKMDETLIFQKLSNQEKILLSALDHLENTTDYNSDNSSN